MVSSTYLDGMASPWDYCLMTKPRAFQVLGSPDVQTAGNGNMVLNFGPRYAKPVDNTMIMSVFHKTTDGSVSVLIDDLSAVALADWLDSNSLDHMIYDTQTTAYLLREFGYVHIAISWNGSGRTARITITDVQAEVLAKWLRTEALTYEWNGWLEPLAVPVTYHGHISRHGVPDPCRLCDMKKEN